MPDLVLPSPDNAHDVSTAIWTPTNVEYIQSWVVGVAEESQVRAVKHEFRLIYRGFEEYFSVLATEDESEALIEDMAAGLAERSATQIIVREQMRGGKLTPTDLAQKENIDVRRDVAGAIRDMRSHAVKRRLTANGKLYYPGLH